MTPFERMTCVVMMIMSIMLFSFSVKADDVSVAGARGINHAEGSGLFALAYSQTLPKGLNPYGWFFIEEQTTIYTKPEVFVGSIGPGFEIPLTKAFFVRGTLGISGMTRTTEELGGHFQFILKGGVGYKFNLFGNQFRIGPYYQHYSSANIYSRNSGLDYVGAELGVELPQEYKIAD